MTPDTPTSYCTFRIGGDLFGADARAVKEVAPLPALTPIPLAPAAARGYVNLRGQIVLALDVNCLLGRKQTQLTCDTQLIVFRPELGDAFGVLADCAGDIVVLYDNQIENHAGAAKSGSSATNAPDEAALLGGVGKLESELLSIIDAGKLLPCVERAVKRCLSLWESGK
jgi:purine-binding chemotaxis protein CheW